MNKIEYDNLRKQAKEKYEKAIQMAEKEHFKTLENIDGVWDSLRDPKDAQVNSKPRIPIVSLPAKKSRSESYGLLTKAVINTLDDIPRNFNKNHIKRSLKKSANEVVSNCNDNSLSGCLIRLQKKGLIEITKRGKGCKPTKYRKKYIED